MESKSSFSKQEKLKTAIMAQIHEIKNHREELEKWVRCQEGEHLSDNELMSAWVDSGMAEDFREDLETSVADENNLWYAGETVGHQPNVKDAWEQYRDHGGHLGHHDRLNSSNA